MTVEQEMLVRSVEDPMLRQSTREKWLRDASGRERDQLLALRQEEQEH